MRHLKHWAALAGVTSVTFLCASGEVRANSIIDLTSPHAAGMGNGAWYIQTDPQPTGTGVIQPFVRIQNTGTESGYNTDGRPVDLQTKDSNQWSRALKISEIPVVQYNGQSYRQFLLDVNEQGSGSGRLLSLDQIEVYLANTGDINDYATLGTSTSKIYTLDTTGNDRTVELDYKLNSGSGSGDMFLLVPNSLFVGPQYVYLFSDFGVPHSADAGFEEWAVLKPSGVGGGAPVPLPTTAAAGFVLLGGFGLVRRANRQPREI